MNKIEQTNASGYPNRRATKNADQALVNAITIRIFFLKMFYSHYMPSDTIDIVLLCPMKNTTTTVNSNALMSL